MEVFEARAAKYNQLAWVSDPEFGRRIVELAEAGPDTVLLDLAAGTGAVSLLFVGGVRQIYAVDNSSGMLEQAKEALGDDPSVQFIHRDGQETGLPDDLKMHLGLERLDGDWVMRHTWALLRLKKAMSMPWVAD